MKERIDNKLSLDDWAQIYVLFTHTKVRAVTLAETYDISRKHVYDIVNYFDKKDPAGKEELAILKALTDLVVFMDMVEKARTKATK